MSIEEYDKFVLPLYSINSIYYEIGKLFYVDRHSEQWIANRLSYSIPSIQKKKHELKNKVKGQ